MNQTISTPAPKQVDNEVSAVKAVRKRTRQANAAVHKKNAPNFSTSGYVENEGSSATAVKAVRKRLPLKKKAKCISPTSGRTEENEDETQKSKAISAIPSNLTYEESLFDKIEVKGKHGFVIGSREKRGDSIEEINLFRRYLCAPPTYYREGNTSEQYGKLATVVPMMGEGKKLIKIRKTPIRYAGDLLQAPLFTGVISMWRTMSGSEEKCEISSHLSINPSRAINHQPNGTSIFRNPVLSEVHRGLDGNDNIVPPSLDKESAHNLQMKHIRDVYDTIVQELQRASVAVDGLPLKGAGSMGTKDISIRHVETYFEFKAAHPTPFLKSLIPTLRAYQADTLARSHQQKQGSPFDEASKRNAETITLFLGKGEEIKIYVKGHNLIRIEVTHKPMRQTNLLKKNVANDLPKLELKLATLKKRAVKRINEMLSYLREWEHESPQCRARAPQYASRWYSSLGRSDVSERIYELLWNNGRLVRGRALNQEDKNLIRRAKDKGLVFYAHGLVYPAKQTIQSDNK